MTYVEKLRDPRWQKRRLEILQRDGFSCRICDDDKNTLNVHHRYYRRDADPWDYDNQALVTLCEQCHEDESADYSAMNRFLVEHVRSLGAFNGDMHEFACVISDSGNRGALDENGWAVFLFHLARLLRAMDGPEREKLTAQYYAWLESKRSARK